MTDLKKCSECGAEKPRTTEHWYKRKGSADGWRNQCKECKRKKDSEYNKSERGREKERQWRNSENGKASRRRYMSTEHGRATQGAANKRYEESPKGKETRAKFEKGEGRAASIARQRARPDFFKRQVEHARRWQRDNPAQHRAICAAYQARKRDAADPTADLEAIETVYRDARLLSEEYGCEMHVDHIIPLARGGKHHEDNLQILPAHLNLSKGAKPPEEFEIPEDWEARP